MLLGFAEAAAAVMKLPYVQHCMQKVDTTASHAMHGHDTLKFRLLEFR